MEQDNLMQIHILIKKIYNLLAETLDISKQMSDAINRNDNVSLQILLNMRSEPIQNLAIANEQIQEFLESYPVEDSVRLRSLLNGEPATQEYEKSFANQVSSNKRMWTQVIELDKQLNLKIAHDKSIYSKNQ